MTIGEIRRELKKHCCETLCTECAAYGKFGMANCGSFDDAVVLTVYNAVKGTDALVEPDNMQKHESICRELNALYARKNADYGDSFHKTFLEEGVAMARIRLSDKLERFKRLTRADEQHVQDESVRDTLIDLANYAIMTVMELDGGKKQ